MADIPIKVTISPSDLGFWQDGVFTAGRRTGEGKLLIEAGGLTASVDLVVTTGRAAGIVAQDFSVMAGYTMDIHAYVVDAVGNEIPEVPITGWTEPEDLGIWSDGKFTAGQTPQKGTLILMSGETRKNVNVTVTPASGP